MVSLCTKLIKIFCKMIKQIYKSLLTINYTNSSSGSNFYLMTNKIGKVKTTAE